MCERGGDPGEEERREREREREREKRLPPYKGDNPAT